MNADDTAKPPANGAFMPPSITPTPASGAQPVRREGILPTSGAQATTGGQPATGQPTGGQQPGGHQPPARQQPQSGQPQSGQAHAAGPQPTSGTMPQRSAFRTTTGVVPASAQPANPQSGQPQAPGAAPLAQRSPSATNPASVTPQTSAPHRPAERAPFQPTGSAPAVAGAAGAAAAVSTAAPATAPPSPTSAGSAPSGGALSVTDRMKSLAGRASDSTKGQLEKADTARKAEATSGPRKARVLVSRIDPWSSLKIGFLLSIAAGIMLVVAMHVLWNVLNSMGTFAMIQEWVSRLFTSEQELNILQFVEYSKVMSGTLLIAVVNVFLLTGLATIGALLYNVISRVVGGVYVTLTDD